MLKTLHYSGRMAGRRPDRLWREQTQEALRSLLDSRGPRLSTAGAASWRQWKADSALLVKESLACLRSGLPSIVPAATVVSTRSYDGFGVERLTVEAVPGWVVGLDLYLPAGGGPFVPIICPCGHGPKWLADHQVPPQVLARNGFAAALFDMPMFGERSRDNDHFIQGPQSLLTGLPSIFYFLVDLVRVADYLQTRADIDFSRGMGVTGVSGGGVATMFMPHVDDRVKAIAPACCTVPLGNHVVDGLYTGCVENYLGGQAAAGLDLHHLICIAAPIPCLVMAGARDELFREPAVRRAYADIERAYALEGAADRLSLIMDDAPHQYTPRMAGHAVRWFRHWLRGVPDAPADERVDLIPESELRCGSDHLTLGMLQMTVRRVTDLASGRAIRCDEAAIRAVLGLAAGSLAADVESVHPPTDWGPLGLHRHVLHPEGDIPVPILEMGYPGAAEGTVLAFGEEGPLAMLRQKGGLGPLRRRMLAADIRGYGELTPESVDYDVYGWCSVDRAIGDLHYLIGRTAAGAQTMDVLRAIHFACAAGEDGIAPTLVGQAGAALPVLFAGILDSRVNRIVLDSGLSTFAALATTPQPVWNRYHYIPDVLRSFDIPELMAAHPGKQFLLLSPRDGDAGELSDQAARVLFPKGQPSNVRLVLGSPSAPAAIAAWLNAHPQAIWSPRPQGAGYSGVTSRQPIPGSVVRRTG